MKNMPGMKVSENKQNDSTYYTCVMHPEIHLAKPGNGPKCGMKLVKHTAKTDNPPVAEPTKPWVVKQPETAIENKEPVKEKTIEKAVHKIESPGLEYAATESGDWFFHCHILYHMMSGMGRIYSYENSPPYPEISNPKYAQRKLFQDDRATHLMAKVGIEHNGSDGEAMLAKTRWKLSNMWHLGYHDELGYESETALGRYFGKMQWWFPYIAFDYHFKKEGLRHDNFFCIEGSPQNIFGSEKYNWFGQLSNKNNRKTIMADVAYTLPMLVMANARIDGDAKFRFQLSREDIAITLRLRFNRMINTDKEYMAGFSDIITKYFSLSTHYDSDMGLGAGVTFIY